MTRHMAVPFPPNIFKRECVGEERVTESLPMLRHQLRVVSGSLANTPCSIWSGAAEADSAPLHVKELSSAGTVRTPRMLSAKASEAQAPSARQVRRGSGTGFYTSIHTAHSQGTEGKTLFTENCACVSCRVVRNAINGGGKINCHPPSP